jgi:microcystin-dependent protein
MPGPMETAMRVSRSTVALASTISLIAGTLCAPVPVAMAQSTGSVGGNQPFDNRQQSIAISLVTRSFGLFGLGVPVRMFAYPRSSIAQGFLSGGDWLLLEGQSLPINENDTLFAQIGTTFGGNGQTTFNLPDARERVIIGTGASLGGPTFTLGQVTGTANQTLTVSNLPVHAHTLPNGTLTGFTGGGQPFNNMQPSLALHFSIARSGTFPTFDGGGNANGPAAPNLAQIFMQCVPPMSNSFTPATGTLLPINQNQALFALMGTLYGGNGLNNFALPDLRGRTPVSGAGVSNIGQVLGANVNTLSLTNMPGHAHMLPGTSTLPTGGNQPFENRQANLVVQYAIATTGLFPSSSGIVDDDGYIGEIVMFAGNFPPNGTRLCDGSLIAISQNTALFSLIGTTYGGNGLSTFALPDLRGRAIVGASANWPSGEVRGSNTVTLSTLQLPVHTHTYARCGLSDIAGPGQSIGPDTQLTADDIITFIGWFFAGDARADVARAGQVATPDGQFTADDLIVFINRFFAGC